MDDSLTKGDSMNVFHRLLETNPKRLAYYLVTFMSGSWLHDVLYNQLEDEEFCKTFIDRFVDQYGIDEHLIEHIEEGEEWVRYLESHGLNEGNGYSK